MNSSLSTKRSSSAEGASARHGLFGAACLSMQSLLLNTLSIPAMALIIRRLGPTNYGQWVTATALVGAVGFLTSLGLRGRFVRAVAQNPDSAPQLLAEQLGARLALTILAMAVVLLACLALGYSSIVFKCTAIASVAMLLTTGWSILLDLMQALERFPTIASVNLASGLLLTIASVLVVLAGGGPVALSLAYLLGPLTTFLLFLVVLRRQHFAVRLCFHPRQIWHLIKDSRHFTAQQLLNAAEANAIALMLPRMIGPSGFGTFSAGALLGDRLTVIPDAVATTLYPVVSKTVHRDLRRTARRVCGVLVITALICVCISSVGTVLAGVIARILLPSIAHDCRKVILITLWALPLVAVQLVMSYSLLARGREASQTRALALAAIANLALAIVLLTRYRILGACGFVIARSAVRICAQLPEFTRTFIVKLDLLHNESQPIVRSSGIEMAAGTSPVRHIAIKQYNVQA